MWTFEDTEGGRWDVVVGRESWGALYALFIPRGEGGVRQTPLAAASHEEAMQEVEEAGGEGLRELFRRSEPKPQ
ncbi:MAG TPA: hypothetical protein VMK65_04455 [Longimicrobiales bacterium]|nr:hypothetical protein [Longimicrobiales bacterium]